MIYPNKHVRFEESIIYKMISILDERDNHTINIHELYERTKDKFKNTDEFIISLDVLYALDMINMNFETETVEYVKGN